MNNRYDTVYQTGARTGAAEFDAGLRAYMLKVYNYMASGVLLTGIVAMLVAGNDALLNLFFHQQTTPQGIRIGYTGLGLLAAFSPLAFVLVLSFGVNRLSASATQTMFWLFAGIMGVSMASILLMYTGESVARTFFITAVAFGSLSLYGYTTKKSLSAWGTFLFMGVIGIVVASLVNMFLQSTMMSFIISVVGVLVFAGLTAYDTQRIKNSYFELAGHGELQAKGAVMGALSLYLDFINMFLMLLRFVGTSRE